MQVLSKSPPVFGESSEIRPEFVNYITNKSLASGLQ